MSYNNTRPLPKNEWRMFNEKYKFELKGDMIVVTARDLKIFHNYNTSFHILNDSNLNDMQTFREGNDVIGFTTRKDLSGRKTFHDFDKPFSLNSRRNPKRKLTFTKVAIDIWIKWQNDDKLKKHTLIDIQNAVSTMLITYRQPTEDNVKEFLKGDIQ